MYSATYSPEDNKLRLYSVGRLPAEIYAKVKAAGFIYAPKQELFVAPAWSPAREDLLLELCEEIGDEDTSLVERAEERADRFKDYSANRAGDAEHASASVQAICDGIPLGQPILVGHHSEKHARKDAERIQNGMRKAVKLWEQSHYWKSRAAGAIRAAKYKERPDVRARRIKGLETDKRRQEKWKDQAEKFLKAWSTENLHIKTALSIANFDHLSFKFPLSEYPRSEPISQYEGDMGLWGALDHGIINEKQAAALAVPCHERMIKQCQRWIDHLNNRLLYERAMMEEAGGLEADRNKPEKGGACRCWASPRGGWSYIQKVNKVSITVFDNWGRGGADFTRTITFDKIKNIMSPAEVKAAREAGQLIELGNIGFALKGNSEPEPARPRPEEPEPAKFEAMRETLKEGVKVVIAPQLFPTPPAIGARMVELAEIQPGDSILEPSAGTGALIAEIRKVNALCLITAVEINPALTDQLRERYSASVAVQGADFLNFDPHKLGWKLGTFDKVLMNPPFENGADIKHINHAMEMLNPGGRLVALCANGPRQQEAFKNTADYWEDLPAGSFKEQGTMVNAALFVIQKKEEGGEIN